MREKLIIGITHGDINGIGYEVIIKTLLDPRIIEMCTPVVYGSPKVAAYHRKALNINNFSFNNVKNVEESNSKRANIIDCLDDNVRVELGKSTTHAGECALKPLQMAIDDLKAGKIDALVTAPINKNNMQSSEFTFPGHSEYLAKRCETEDFLMLLVSESLRVGVVAGHIPISKVSSYITEALILSKLRIMNESLIKDFGIRKPRIAVLGLNPHAGDEGVIGDEEKKVIIPAINKAKTENIMALGPYPADGLFGSDNMSKFDGILAMYHDQGLVPFKTLYFDSGVNFTAGLPIVRTSPDHGTAYDIVGKGIASEESFRQALYMAIDIVKNRNQYKELRKNPLQSFETPN